MTVSFVSFSRKLNAYIEDPSFRYRCENLSNGLNKVNITSRLDHIGSFHITSDLSLVILHRPIYSRSLKLLIRQLKTQGIIVTADFDDLVFDSNYINFSPAVLNSKQTLRKVRQRFISHHKAASLVDHITVSTLPLLRYAKQCFPYTNVSVVHNHLHFDWAHHTYNQHNKTNKEKVLTYFPGTQSHDRDFWQIEDVLSSFLSSYKEVKLVVIGPLNSALLQKRQNSNISHFERLPFNEYIKAVSSSWVNLLPLEPTPFNQCKSAIKVIEAGSYCTPTICSPLPDSTRFTSSFAVTALGEQEWHDTLTEFINKPPAATTQEVLNFTKSTDNSIMAQELCSVFDINIRSNNLD